MVLVVKFGPKDSNTGEFVLPLRSTNSNGQRRSLSAPWNTGQEFYQDE